MNKKIWVFITGPYERAKGDWFQCSRLRQQSQSTVFAKCQLAAGQRITYDKRLQKHELISEDIKKEKSKFLYTEKTSQYHQSDFCVIFT